MYSLRSILTTAATAASLVLFGCAQPSNPWTFTSPPTTIDATAATTRPNARRITIVVGEFNDPSKAPNYSKGVGRCIGDAFSRALMNDGRFNVLIRESLSVRVDRIAADPSVDQQQELTKIAAEFPQIDFVITGKVTDFHHTGDLPDEISRHGLFGRRNEAITAIDLRIVDLQSRRIVGANHLKGTASAGRTPSRELYRDVALDSYLFWSTPLGRASKSAIELAVSRTESVVPGRALAAARGEPLSGDPLVRVAWGRRLEILGGSRAGLVRGGRYYLLRQADRTGHLEPVPDRITGEPLTVSILSLDEDSARAMMLGERPRDLDITGALLRPSLPEARPAEPTPAPPERADAAPAT